SGSTRPRPAQSHLVPWAGNNTPTRLHHPSALRHPEHVYCLPCRLTDPKTNQKPAVRPHRSGGLLPSPGGATPRQAGDRMPRATPTATLQAEKRASVRTLHAQGMSATAIAQHLGVHVSTVSRWAKADGVEF